MPSKSSETPETIAIAEAEASGAQMTKMPSVIVITANRRYTHQSA